MSIRVEYHDLVDLDLLNAWTWYENQEDGLGDRFLGAICNHRPGVAMAQRRQARPS